MAIRTPRFAPALYNLAIASSTAITASSYQTALPPAFLRDALPTKRWRSATGWNIVAGFNDRIDFNRSGVKVATITPGNYVSGAALAAAIVTALEAADAPPVWACSYNVGTRKFTISSDLAFTLLFGTGANLTRSVAPDLGFAVADTGSSTTFTGGSATFHSREWLLFDLGSAQAFTVGIAFGHNLGTGGTITLKAKAAADVWVAPSFTQVLTSDDLAGKRSAFFASQSFRYVLLQFDDTGNSNGYTELGIAHAGTYWEPGRGYQPGANRQAVPLSVVVRGDQGALQIARRPSPKVLALIFSGLSRTDRDTYQAIEDDHRHLFLFKDPQNLPGVETTYGAITDPARVTDYGPLGDLFTIETSLAENLG